MKLIYSHLKTFLPDLSVSPEKLRDDLTLIGHFCNFYEKIGQEIVFDLDIKVNRGDCLGYYGLAKDLSIFYNLTFIVPKIVLPLDDNKDKIDISVKTSTVKRLMAIRLTDIKNSKSPKWLQNFLKLHGTHPINTLVDLTNYIMFMYGLPPHAFDTKKSSDSFIWQLNPGYNQFTTLDGTKLTLNKDILMITNMDIPLSLSFWGGKHSAITQKTTDCLLEIAIYDPVTVRQNMRFLKAQTDAGLRLEKQLSPDLIPLAFKHLVKLITENCGGQISSSLFDYYPQTKKEVTPKLNNQLLKKISGINIPSNFFNRIIKNLDLSLRPDLDNDISLAGDIIRFYGINKIPINKPLKNKKVADITPKINYLIDSLRDQLISLGYDEVLTWPLTKKPFDQKTVVKTENSINQEYIYLRQSLIPALRDQLDSYRRLKLTNQKFFEIGTIFFYINGQYIEKNSLAIYNYDTNQLRSDINSLKIHIAKEKLIKIDNFTEIDLDKLTFPQLYSPKLNLSSKAVELSSQIITLDANLTLNKSEIPQKLLKKYKQLIDPEILWDLKITDIYHDPKNNRYRYTFQVSYYNCDDKTAKRVHLSTFNLL